MTDISNYSIFLISQNPNFMKQFEADLKSHYQTFRLKDSDAYLIKDNPAKFKIAIVDGDLCGQATSSLREQNNYSQLGIVVVSNLDGFFKEEFAFHSGADFFLTQISNFKSLHLRIKAILQRTSEKSESVSTHTLNNTRESSISYKGLTIFPNDFIVKSEDRIVKITPMQFKLLVNFFAHSGQLLSRDWLKTNIWEEQEISLRSIDAQVSKLKKALPEVAEGIINIYGRGYIFNMDESSSESKKQAA